MDGRKNEGNNISNLAWQYKSTHNESFFFFFSPLIRILRNFHHLYFERGGKNRILRWNSQNYWGQELYVKTTGFIILHYEVVNISVYMKQHMIV